MTRYAEQILNLINASCEHLSAEQIFFELKKGGSEIAHASVYNNLNSLSERGLIRKLSVDGQTRYDKIKKHDHLVCKICGKISDFEFEDLTENLKEQLRSGVVAYDLKVYYECPECANKKN